MTRPKHQAENLCALIAANGGQAIPFPTIKIQAVAASELVSSRFNTIDEYDLVIFVSRNAVKIAFDLYLDESALPEHVQCVAIGAGTAEALSEMNITNVLHGGVKADSETLLQLPELQAEHLQGKKVLIVRGVGGRELLADNLTARGALLEYAEVYRRCLPEYEIKDVHKIWQELKPAAAIMSSNDGLKNLLSLTMDNDRHSCLLHRWLSCRAGQLNLQKTWLCLGDRSCQAKNDAGLLSALLELVGD